MISIIRPLPSIAYLDEKVDIGLLCKLNGNIVGNTQPKTAVWMFDGSVNENSSITIQFTETDDTVSTITFVAKNNPTEDHHIPTHTAGAFFSNLGAYFAEISQNMNANHLFKRFMVVYPVVQGFENGLVFQGTKCQIDSTIAVTAAWGADIYNNVVTQGSRSTADYGVEINILGQYPSPASGIAYPDSDGKITFSFADVLKNDAIFSHEFMTPPNPYLGAHSIGKAQFYSIRFREIIDGAKNPFLDLGLQRMLWSRTEPTQFASSLPKRQAFLPNDPRIVTWINATGVAQQPTLKFDVFTTQNQSNAFYTVMPTVKHCESIQFKIPTNPENAIVKVSLEIAGNPTETITFVQDRDTKARHHLMFLNRFGAWEVVTFWGETTHQHEFKRQEAQKTLQNGQIGVFNSKTSWSRFRVYHTGWIPESHTDALAELLSSPYVYEVNPEGYCQIRFLESKLNPIKHDLNSFELRAASTENQKITKFTTWI
jgi:hypothetical protein